MNDAITEYQAAVRLKPDNAGLHHNLGAALLSEGRAAEAALQFKLGERRP